MARPRKQVQEVLQEKIQENVIEDLSSLVIITQRFDDYKATIRSELEILQSFLIYQKNHYQLSMGNLMPQTMIFKGELEKLQQACQAAIDSIITLNK